MAGSAAGTGPVQQCSTCMGSAANSVYWMLYITFEQTHSRWSETDRRFDKAAMESQKLTTQREYGSNLAVDVG